MADCSRPRSREEFEIAVVCALPSEHDAVALAFDRFWDEGGAGFGKAAGDQNTYTTGRIGCHNVVLVLLPNMGKASAAGTAASLRSSYPGLRLVALAGICGAVPNSSTTGEVLLGDVIISTTVVQYDLGRRYPGKFQRKDTIDDDFHRPNKAIRSLLALLRTEHGRGRLRQGTIRVLGQIQDKAVGLARQTAYHRPTAAEDVLFEPDYLHKHPPGLGCECDRPLSACAIATAASCSELRCDLAYTVNRKRLMRGEKLVGNGRGRGDEDPEIFLGCIGSGDTVMKSGQDRDRIANEHGLIAFEMEGAGVWDELPCIVVKGVCDYADSHKNKAWQSYAAAAAAAATKTLLSTYPRTDRPENASALGQTLPVPVESHQVANIFYYGNGTQLNNSGSGTQNNALGSGKQFFAQTMTFAAP